MPKTFHSLAPRLRNERGHELAYHTAVEKAAALMGLPYQAYVADDCEAKLPSQQWLKYFRPQKLWQDIGQLFRTKKGVFFLESFTGRDLLVITASALLFAGQNTELLLLLRYGKCQLTAKGRLHLLCLKLLKAKLGKRFKGLTDSELVAISWPEKLQVVPIPHTEHFLSRPPPLKKIFWWPGIPRPAKGFEEMVYLASLPDAKEIEIVAARDSKLPVTLVDDILSRDEYCTLMGKSSVVLLPYDPETYRYGTSGILVEAVIAGKMPLVKEGSWLAAELRRYDLEELIVDWTNPHFFSHALQLLSSTKEKLARMQQAYAAYHSTQTFANELRRIIG